MSHTFTIGNFSFSVDAPEQFFINDNFNLFKDDHCFPVFHYKVSVEESLPGCKGRIITKLDDLVVYDDNGLEWRMLTRKGGNTPYAVYRELDECHADVIIKRDHYKFRFSDPFFVSFFALEKRLLNQDGLILHSAYMLYKNTAVLFSAPSGTGKSTQAALWEQYRGTRQVNGDRSLLQKKDGIWFACGWPVCGSSMICHNESYPIRAIVMISQAEENRVEMLRPFRIFKEIYPEITVNRWDESAVNRAMSLINGLISEVPIYHLRCNISQDAVECLEAVIK